MSLAFQILDWGLIDYQQALEEQKKLAQLVRAHSMDGYLIFCSHPPVVTLGRKTQTNDVTYWSGPIVEVSRGGRATYHGPSQIIMYPIIDLEKLSPPRDIPVYMRRLEEITIAALAEYQIHAVGKSLTTTQTNLEDTGVWVGAKKIASLGVGVTQWVTYHGLALNLDFDPSAFKGINPCGYQSSVMTSLEELLGYKIDKLLFQNLLAKHFVKLMS